MKKIAFALIAGLGITSSVLAGQPPADKNTVVPVEPCFQDREFQLDVFGNFQHFPNGKKQKTDNGGGGGLGLNYFFCRYAGLGIDASVNSLSHGLFDSTGSLILRYPLELGGVCLAPYAIGGGGVQTGVGRAAGIWHAGGGLEWRATPKFGIYGEGRYTWANKNRQETSQARLGLRFAF